MAEYGSEGSGLFGTDGIRGKANSWPLTPEFVVRLGQAVASSLFVFKPSIRPRVAVAWDTRLSGDLLVSSLAAGLMSSGVDVVKLGVLPTPAAAFVSCEREIAVTAVISASHNSFIDNGIKFFDGKGLKIPLEWEQWIELQIPSELTANSRIHVGRYIDGESWKSTYLALVLNLASQVRLDSSVKIVVDCAHGALSGLAENVLAHTGATILSIASEPDGRNINDGCGSTNPSTISNAVKNRYASLGIAFDGDGDRVIFADENGQILDGDFTLAILARDLKLAGRLSKNTVVGTIMSNVGLEVSLAAVGVRLVRVPVGDKYVTQKLMEDGLALGGEQSGHIIMPHTGQTAGDGLVTAIAILKLLGGSRPKQLSELASCMEKHPQILVNVAVHDKLPIHEIDGLIDGICESEKRLGEWGRVSVRYSGTEPLLRVMVEGSDAGLVENEASNLAALVHRAIGTDKVPESIWLV